MVQADAVDINDEGCPIDGYETTECPLDIAWRKLTAHAAL